jgi:murein DD-endopeptidase MepM/ murein hydrolase activator NlpD
MNNNGTGRVTGRLLNRLNTALSRYLPEQRLFLKSDTGTRFIRLKPGTLAVALIGSATLVCWTILATAMLFIHSIGAGNARDQAQREKAVYEARLDALSQERDVRAAEAVAAQERFNVALAQVSAMQSTLLASEERRREMETGIGVIQATLRRTVGERNEARTQLADATAPATDSALHSTDLAERVDDLAATLDFMSAALGRTAGERDDMANQAKAAKNEADEIAYEKRLMEDRHDQIFNQLEDAVTISMEPLDKMFKAAGLNPDDLLNEVRRGYSGIGGPSGPLLPMTYSTKGTVEVDPFAERAGAILGGLDRMNLYRIAAEKAPFSLPLKSSFRFTSGFGQRWGRLHAGADMASSYGTPVYSTADGVVVHAGWLSGYGRLIKIRHEFGIETRYGHLSQIRVKVGQKVSRGDRIGDMGNSGHSTGTHLHYEVRVNGTPLNPMTFIKAASNVF